MKTEMQMLPNGNYESVVCPIQHKCVGFGSCDWNCVEYSWKEGLFLSCESDEVEFCGDAINVKFCPFCGYKYERVL